MNAQQPQELIASSGTRVALTPIELLDRALQSNASIEVLKGLMELQERWEKNQARKSFDAAVADAKAEIPIIEKNKHVGFESKDKSKARTDYWHEDLAQVARTIDPILGKHGLSYRFRTASPIDQPVSVTCILSHRDGCSEENTLTAGRDATGNKNSIQQIGSTITYLQRYTLKAALGLAASKDDDGDGADGQPETISPEQVAELRSIIVEAGADLSKFLRFMGVEHLEDIQATHIDKAKHALAQKVRAAK